MVERQGGGVWAALAWLAFPAVPVALEGLYNGTLQFAGGSGRLSPDPRDWGWFAWVCELGPLIGFGFLAGATAGLADEPIEVGTRWRRLRGWLGRRSVRVAVGPWMGFLGWVALWWLFASAASYLPVIDLTNSWLGQAVAWILLVGFILTFSYAWLWPAVGVVRRADRSGEAWGSVKRGVAWALAFVGSLFGSFWAITESWRSFFFDPRMMPVLLATLSVGLVSGCGAPISYGDSRRRELFHAMLLAWTAGLAMLWQWWGRPRKR